MSETPLDWSEFEKALIKFVETNQKDERFLRLRRGRYVSYSGLWDTYGEKWKVSNETCQIQWQSIINTYFKIKTHPLKFSETTKIKYQDGRLSFLDSFVKQKVLKRDLDKIKKTSTNYSKSIMSLDNSKGLSTTASDTKEKTKSSKLLLITEDTDKESCINFLRHVAIKDKFDKFDECLIDYVKKYAILYDIRFTLNIEHKIRKVTEDELWEKLMKKTNISESQCRVKWSQIRVEYFCVRKAQDFNITIKKPGLLKYLDGRFNFLEPVYLVIKIFSVGILTRKPLEEIIRNRGCAWNDFQLSIIQFVKANPIINEFKRGRGSTYKDIWNQISKHLGASADDCIKCWNRIKYANFKFVKKHEGKKLDYTSLFDFRYKALAFLNKQAKCIDESSDNSSKIEDFEAVTKSDEEELVKSELQDSNLFDDVIEIEDTSFVRDKNFEFYIETDIVLQTDALQPSTSANFISLYPEDSTCRDGVIRSSKEKDKSQTIDSESSFNVFHDASLCFNTQLIKLEPEEENIFTNTEEIAIENTSFLNFEPEINSACVSYNDESQPSTSTNFVSTRKEDSNSGDSTNEDYIRSTVKRKYKATDDNDSEEINASNIHKLNTNDFFLHFGRFVSESFSEESQQEFRLKCWDLYNLFRLDKGEIKL